MRDSNDDLQSEYTVESNAGPAIDIMAIPRLLRREWRFPVVGCLIGLVLAISYVVSTPTLYKSSARILVDRSLNRYLQANKISDQPTLDHAELMSQVHILSSESIIIPVVRSMNLAEDSEFVGPPSGLVPQVLDSFHMLTRIVKQSIGWHNDVIVDSEAARERMVVETFLKRLSVYREDVANVITVSFEARDSNKTANIANAIADAYIAATIEARTRSTKMASQWLQDRLAELKVQAIEADRALQHYKTANDLIYSDKGSLNSDQLSALSTQLTNARMAMAEAKARFDRIRQTISEGIPSASAPDALKDSIIEKLRLQYMDLASRTGDMESRVGREHMAVVKNHERMDELLALIRKEEQRLAGSEYEIAKARESGLATAMSQLVDEARTRSEAQVKMRQFESSAETFRQLYDSVLQKFQETNTIHATLAVQDARIVSRAAPPLYKSSRKAVAVLAGGIVLGFFLGAGAAVAREWAADVFRTPNVVKELTGIHCVMLPMVRRAASARDDTKPVRAEEIVLDEPFSRFTEGLRSVKVLINAARLAHGVKVIGVVSSVPKEGKTIVAANLAALMSATSGIRTLIIDGDLHMRLLTARLAPDANGGLIEALSDPSWLATLVSKRQRSGLDVLPCVLSTRIPNAADLLGGPQMEQLLATARNAYDCIIIEIPPIMSVVDVMMIERFIDRFIFVIEWGQTKRGLVLEALSEAHIIRERLMTMILNKADPHALRSIEAYKGDKFKDYYEA